MGNDVYIGNNVIILPGVTIGSKVVIGAGAIVSRDVPDNSIEYNQQLADTCALYSALAYEDARITTKEMASSYMSNPKLYKGLLSASFNKLLSN
jgi:UDP-3-O-[3-hydroxymyristoyl] glucosamine N-acyltransferase